mgnify:CR=1 FL=1
MCHVCVMESVKARMLSRRQFLSAAPAATIGAAGLATASRATAQTSGRVVDLTYAIDEAFPTWSGPPGISIEQLAKFEESGFNAFSLQVGDHTGTHIDAPLHFSADGQSVEEIPAESLICPLCVIDIREKADANDDAEVTPEDLSAWISRNGDIPDGALVAMNSGWQQHVETPKFIGFDGDGVRHYPAFHVEAAQMLMENTGAVALSFSAKLFRGGSPVFGELSSSDADVLRSAATSFGSTVLLVTHNSAIARMADRVVHLHSGSIVEDDLQPQPADASELQW